MLTPDAPNPAPIGNEKRQAHDKFKGYQYQIWYAVLCWIDLEPDQDIYVETAEDVDLVSSDEMQAGQLKHTAASLSLNTAAAMKALGDYWELRKLNPKRRVLFNYITTGDTAKEENATFTGDRVGLDVWQSAKSNDIDAEEIRAFLLKKITGSSLPADLITLLKDGPIGEVLEKLIRPITWQTGAPSYQDMIAQVDDAIYAYSARINDPFPTDVIESFRKELFAEAVQATVSKRDRKLTARDFTTLFKARTRITLSWTLNPYAVVPPGGPPVALANLAVAWKAASEDLASWPTSVGDNRELERPELEAIAKAIKESPWSARILLGEAGSGKSALLATLIKRLEGEGTAYLGLKVDFIPAETESLEELVQGLEGRTLVEAVKAEAKKHPFVVVVDQLDAICNLTDKKTRRLALILNFLRELAQVDNVHIVASCRPFEFKFDQRLQRLNGAAVHLELPPWEKVVALLKEEKVDPNEFAAGNKDVLRVPWNLKLYLSLKAPRPALTSFYDLAEKAWGKAVQDVENSGRHLELVDLIAREIDEREEFWIPKALTDGYVAERNLLIGQSILMQPPQASLIGFRHQTFYDYFLLNVFLRQRLSFEDYIARHGQSFFIRPTVTRALAYLREFDRHAYTQAVSSLTAKADLSRHLKYLIIEFLSRQQAPTRDEVALLLPMLNDDATGRQFLQGVTGSKGWFEALIGTSFEPDWMCSVPRNGVVTLLLCSAITFAEDEVVSLISKHWLDNQKFDSASMWVLSQAKTWKPATIELLQTLVKRARLEDVTWPLSQLIRSSPTSAAPLIGSLFKRAVDEVRVELEEQQAAASPEDRRLPTAEELEALTPAQAAKVFDRVFEDEPAVKKIKALLAGDLFRHAGLGQVAKHDPQGFLRETWADVKRMLELTQDAKTEPSLAYDHDAIGVKDRSIYPERHESVIGVIELALEQLAKAAPADFQQWADQEKTGSSLTVHRLIAQGAKELPPEFADWVVSYLLGDRRRLYLGDVQDETDNSRQLIRAFGPHASQALLDELAVQLVNLPSDLLPIAQRLYPRTDEHRQRGALRRERARLLAVFPPSRLSESGQAALAQDIADFGPPRTQRRPGPMASFVGAPVRAEEFAGKSEEEVFAVLDKYPDDYDRSLVPASSQEEISRSGGSDQQSVAFAGFATTNIEMGRLMMKRFKPGRHEKYAAALLSHWASPKQDGSRPLPPVVTYAELEQMALDFAASGFKSDHFRGHAARVLQGVAKNNKGLRPETIELLQQWIPEVKFPESDDYGPSDREENKHSILYSMGGSWLSTMGRAEVVVALIEGWIFQQPAKIEDTVAFLEKLAETEHHPAVWAEILITSPWLVSRAPERMSRLITKLFDELPALLVYSQTAHFLSDVSGIIKPTETEAAWIAKLLAKPESMSKLLAGELTILHFVRCKSEWSSDLIAEALDGRHGEDFQRGVTFGAGAFIRDKAFAHELDPILARGLESPIASLQDAALTFLHHVDDKMWTPAAKRLVEQVLKMDLSQQRRSESLASQMDKVALVDPAFALTVVEHYLAMMKADPAKSNDWSWGTDHLTSIVLLALREPATRERALKVFEDLLDLSVQDARKAADLMNHRE